MQVQSKCQHQRFNQFDDTRSIHTVQCMLGNSTKTNSRDDVSHIMRKVKCIYAYMQFDLQRSNGFDSTYEVLILYNAYYQTVTLHASFVVHTEISSY